MSGPPQGEQGGRLNSRLWGLNCKARVDEAMGLFPHALPFQSVPSEVEQPDEVVGVDQGLG